MINLLLFASILITCYSQLSNRDLRFLPANSSNPIKIIGDTNNQTVVLNLTGIGENLYTFKVLVGTPPQSFNVVYDLLSFESYFPSIECTNCSDVLFNRNLSSTNIYNGTNLTAQYIPISGSVNGRIDADMITFGMNTNSTTNNYGFILANSSTISAKYQGLISFGYDYKGRIVNYTNSLESSNFTTNMNILEVLLSTLNNSTKVITQKIINETTGYLYLGSYLPEINTTSENYTYCSIPIGSSQWKCDISHVLIGSSFDSEKALELNTSNAVFSTLAKHIVAPNITFDYFNKIFHLHNCSQTTEDIYSLYSCTNQVKLTNDTDIHFVLNNTAYYLNSSDLFSKPDDKNISNFKILFKQDLNDRDWILGQLLLKNYEMIFDANKNVIIFNGGIRHKLLDTSNLKMFILIGIGGLIVIVISIFVSCYCCKKRGDNEYQPQN